MPVEREMSEAEYSKEVDDAIQAWKENYIYEMSLAIMESYAQYDIALHQIMGFDPMDHMSVISQSALAYAKDYGDMLEKEGATVIKGQKVPWLANLEQEMRKEVSTIISEGVKPGWTDPNDPRASEPSINDRLEVYFHKKKNHANTVARTEVGRIQNISTLNRLKEFGYKMVRVIDNEGVNSCEACKRANGQLWTIDHAMANELEHPHCVRAFSAYSGPESPKF